MQLVVHLESPVAAFRPTDRQLDGLRAKLPEYQVVRAASERDFLERLPEADAVAVGKFLVEWYARAPKLRCVSTPAAGRELVAPEPSGRVSVHFSTFHGKIMAESLLAMVLFMKRRLDAALRAQDARSWDRDPYVETRGLAGETALIVGLGAIGVHCARLLRAVGMKVHGLRRDPAKGGAEEVDRLFALAELDHALPLADHVACVLPGDTGTDNLLGARELALMKPTACVYNLGRGNAIDAAALMRALRARKIQGAFLDVFPEEPLPKDSRLWSTPNLFVTPHASAVRVDYIDLYFEELAALLGASS